MNELASFKARLDALIQKSQSLLITSHKQPDDDSIASVLIMYDYLHRTYPKKHIEIRYTAEPNDRWQYFEHFENIQFITDIAQTALDAFDAIIILDTLKYNRITNQTRVIKQSRAKKVCIDHHASQGDTFDLTYLSPAPATTYLLYELLYGAQQTPISPRLAELFILGIWGDTGGLRHVDLMHVQVYSLLGSLITQSGKPLDELEAKYQPYSETVFITLREMLDSQTIHNATGWPNITTAYLSREFVTKHRLTQSQIYEAYKIFTNNYLTCIAEAPWGAVFYPSGDLDVGISLRSRPGAVNVRHIVERQGIGGGHDYAAGAIYTSHNHQPLEPQACLHHFLDWLKDHPNQPYHSIREYTE